MSYNIAKYVIGWRFNGLHDGETMVNLSQTIFLRSNNEVLKGTNTHTHSQHVLTHAHTHTHTHTQHSLTHAHTLNTHSHTHTHTHRHCNICSRLEYNRIINPVSNSIIMCGGINVIYLISSEHLGIKSN